MSSVSRRIGSTLAIISALGLSSVAMAAEPATAGNSDASATVQQKTHDAKKAARKEAHHTKEAATKAHHDARRKVHEATGTGGKGGAVEKAQDKASEAKQQAADKINEATGE